ncbi:DUF4124 domain-containing protein [Aeromonas lusitana]|uniref:DUF4124 domain-containing protein n=1 Tax=Aeromonas lusitana TaxID=931529 RepID=A0A2M8H574_9GAMM|nr:DUF4124 domain-containing protein [Aeromonas lusitana]PJC91680.1 DUF4124 domain-containing protein [Aeromonas lusitana]
MKTVHPTWMLGLLLMLAGTAQAAKVFSWVDANGITHYTDAPPPGKNAKELDLRVSPLIGTSPHSVQVDNFNSLTGADAKKAQENIKPTIELLSPEPGSTLRDNTGNIVFQGQIHPQAPVQYDVRLILNGKAVPLVHNSLAIRVENLDRGAHEAQLELLAKDGTILAKSKPSTFYLHRTTADQAPKPTPKTN